VTHLDSEYVVKRLPVIFRKYMSYGFDIRKQPIEVKPRPHYLCGGVMIDSRSETRVRGLYAAGAVTAGVHGANRLGSNALTDILVFGDIAGRHAALHSKQKSDNGSPCGQQVEDEINRISQLLADKTKPVTVPALRRKHCEMMDAHMGVIREEEGLKTMLNEIARAEAEDLPNLIVRDKSRYYNYELRDALEVPFRLSLEKMSTSAAFMRKESRGSHFREDFPTRNDPEWVKNIVFSKKEGALSMEVREVDQSVVKIEELPDYASSDSPWH
jgi:succinate dehydrogenase/fumarate reductase flavoprotein subunit